MFYAIDTMQNIAAILVSISIFINSIFISLSLRFWPTVFCCVFYWPS